MLSDVSGELSPIHNHHPRQSKHNSGRILYLLCNQAMHLSMLGRGIRYKQCHYRRGDNISHLSIAHCCRVCPLTRSRCHKTHRNPICSSRLLLAAHACLAHGILAKGGTAASGTHMFYGCFYSLFTMREKLILNTGTSRRRGPTTSATAYLKSVRRQVRHQLFSWADHVRGLTTRIHAGSPAVGKCFDCKLAINWRKHYELTGREYVLNDDVDSWYCAGGGYPPRACPSGDYTNTWDWSDCACKNGTYTDPQNSKSCIPCPRGRYCTMNVSRPCPMHYFQDDEGATACKPCASSADELGITNVCDLFNKQLRVCDPAHPETQSRPLVSNCMECSKCKVRYQAEIAGQVDCYRSTQIK